VLTDVSRSGDRAPAIRSRMAAVQKVVFAEAGSGFPKPTCHDKILERRGNPST